MNILYVCTGNIFRSMAAEYLTKKYIEDHDIDDMIVSSAWTSARPQEPFPRTIERLNFYGCDPSQHQQRKISPKILKAQNLIICMAEHHRQTIKELWFDAVLFNEIAYEKSEDLMDDTEFMQLHGPSLNLEEYAKEIVDYIHETIPTIIKNITKKP